ncbi:MAG: hypothetical protein M3R13_01280 [Armatimonadota bacterium]|nr:hypothetical protein [Armatimonadota bacterium]
MNRRLAPLFLAALVAFVILSGCGRTSYSNESDYRAARGTALGIEADSGSEVSAPGGQRFYVWTLKSGEAWADALVGDTFAIDRSIGFGNADEAAAFIATVGLEDQVPTNPPTTFMSDRAAALGADSGSYLANGDGGAYILWMMPDGTFTRDFITLDRTGYTIAATETFATKEEADAGIERIPTFEAYIAERSQELGAAPAWGSNTRSFKIYAFSDPGGQTTVDVLSANADPKLGGVRQQSMQFADMGAAIAGISAQLKDENTQWITASQYSRLGWGMIAFFLIIVALILFNIQMARKGKGGTIRRISGLDQIDEAVGRATEIARPVLMVPGLGTLNGVTVQALTIFAYVIRTAARFGTPIRLLNADASVYAVAQEITRDVYMSEGVPEAYDPTSVRFVSDRQFAFAAGVAGTIQREKVAATFFMGDFFAESMIFAENANMVGAIQVAATTQFTQTPFFIAACDYVLLGDEFYAASAYLGRQPILVGSLIGVDKSKMLIMAMVIVMCLVHSVQTLRKVDPSTLPPETQTVWESTGQQYLDWRKDDLFFKRIPKIERP